MPPKKKEDIIIGGVKTNDMTRDEIEELAIRMKEELDREREERNYFQIERDKIRMFWELTKDQVDECRAQVRNLDREMEEAREKKAEDIKIFKQKIKYLNYQQEINLAELKAADLVNLKIAENDHLAEELKLQEQKSNLKQKLLDEQKEFEHTYKNIVENNEKEIEEIRKEFEIKAKELEEDYEKQFKILKYDLTLKHRMEIAEVKERKNRQINDLIEKHEINFGELKTYYNDITLNNLALIASLKEQTELQSDQLQNIYKQTTETAAENKRLVELKDHALNDARNLKRQMQNYEKDKLSLNSTMQLLTNLQMKHANLLTTNENLEKQFLEIKEQRDVLNSKFVSTITEIQQQVRTKYANLQKRITVLNNMLEERDAMLMKMAKSVPIPLGEIQNDMEKLIKSKNEKIKSLRYELMKASKMHDDIIHSFEAILCKYGVQKEDLEFTTIQSMKAGASLIVQGPAGLITKNK